MRRYELVPEPVVVWKDTEQRGSEAADGFARLTAVTPEELLDAVDSLSPAELESAVVQIDAAITEDSVIALAAALVDRGVVAIETRYVVAINRVFETRRAFETGTLAEAT